MGTIMLEQRRQERLLHLMEEKGFILSQQNGQRIYGGPPPNWGARPTPPRESEIFIGRLPRMCFEDELIPLFSSIGELYEFRLMLDFSGSNRGFAYARYATQESAKNAIKLLNHYEIRPGHHIGVLKSKNNCRLLFSNIKEDKISYDFTACVKSATSGVLTVYTFANLQELKDAEMGLSLEVEEGFQEKIARYAPNSHFAIVEYETHKAAALARRVLIPKFGHMFGIDWAIPLQDKNQFDQSYNYHQEISSGPGSEYVKTRPVPVFSPRRSSIDGILYTTNIFRNIAKYFKFLLNTTLHKAMRKGDIPLAVYLEMEKKIIERIKNVDHCGQATQLILNYLTWYSEKIMIILDLPSEKILQEIKYYSERMVQIANNRLTCTNDVKSEMEVYVSNTLPVHLNFCYYMAVFLSGDERYNVCGLITDSINWFEQIMQKVRLGNERVTQFLMEISVLAREMEAEKKRGEMLVSMQKSHSKRTSEQNPDRNISSLTQFSSQSFLSLNDTPLFGMIGQEFMLTAESVQSSRQIETRPIDVSVHDSENQIALLGRTVGQEQQPNPNLLDSLGDLASSVPHFPQNSSGGVASLPGITPGTEGGFHPNRSMETFTENESMKDRRQLPILVPKPSITDFVPYMPKSYYNIVKYYKYLIISNIQKSVERCEITLHMYREITMNVINNMTNVEMCIQGLSLIMSYLTVNREAKSHASEDDLLKSLQDIQFHGSSLVSYLYNRESGLQMDANLEEYYCHTLPNQISFLYHLTVLLNGEEKAKISAGLTDSLKWLNGLIRKNRAGDVEVVGFFERISRIEVHNTNGGAIAVREMIKDVFDEFNSLMGPVTKSQP